ncbi:MAG TPA: hypothetical protein VHE58_08505 [Burkholderiales bacterium]|nr:hypothetical protein [Burkholderiales bacterium]
MPDKLTESALHYHRFPTPGKTEVIATKPLATQADLALAVMDANAERFEQASLKL